MTLTAYDVISKILAARAANVAAKVAQRKAAARNLIANSTFSIQPKLALQLVKEGFRTAKSVEYLINDSIDLAGLKNPTPAQAYAAWKESF